MCVREEAFLQTGFRAMRGRRVFAFQKGVYTRVGSCVVW